MKVPEGSEGRSFLPVVRISIDGGLVGRIAFRLNANATITTPASTLAGVSARRYEHAFLSYASVDRTEVLKRAQVLEAAGVSFFQDILKLDPGERFEREIFRHIDTCDLFLLFWSQAAKESEWVIREVEYARARQGDGDVPDKRLEDSQELTHVCAACSGVSYADIASRVRRRCRLPDP